MSREFGVFFLEFYFIKYTIKHNYTYLMLIIVSRIKKCIKCEFVCYCDFHNEILVILFIVKIHLCLINACSNEMCVCVFHSEI